MDDALALLVDLRDALLHDGEFRTMHGIVIDMPADFGIRLAEDVVHGLEAVRVEEAARRPAEAQVLVLPEEVDTLRLHEAFPEHRVVMELVDMMLRRQARRIDIELVHQGDGRTLAVFADVLDADQRARPARFGDDDDGKFFPGIVALAILDAEDV